MYFCDFSNISHCHKLNPQIDERNIKSSNLLLMPKKKYQKNIKFALQFHILNFPLGFKQIVKCTMYMHSFPYRIILNILLSFTLFIIYWTEHVNYKKKNTKRSQPTHIKYIKKNCEKYF